MFKASVCKAPVKFSVMLFVLCDVYKFVFTEYGNENNNAQRKYTRKLFRRMEIKFKLPYFNFKLKQKLSSERKYQSLVHCIFDRSICREKGFASTRNYTGTRSKAYAWMVYRGWASDLLL